MFLTPLDFVLLIILFFFAFGGFFFGLIHSVGAVIGTIVGAVIGANFFDIVAGWIGNPFGISDNWVKIVSFALIFIVANRLVGLVFWLIDKFVKLGLIPFIKTINRLGGLVFGVIEGSLILGIGLVFLIRFPLSDILLPMIQNSNVALYLFKIGTWMLPLLPEVFGYVRGII